MLVYTNEYGNIHFFDTKEENELFKYTEVSLFIYLS